MATAGTARSFSDGDYAASIGDLARSIGAAVAGGAESQALRMAAEFASWFRSADQQLRRTMIAEDPPSTGAATWDAFVGGLAEWLAVAAGVPTPEWTGRDERFLRRGWWVSPMRSMRAWEYAGSPISFKIRGVYIHRDSVTNI